MRNRIGQGKSVNKAQLILIKAVSPVKGDTAICIIAICSCIISPESYFPEIRCMYEYDGYPGVTCMIYRGVKLDTESKKRRDQRDLLKAAVIVLGVAAVAAAAVLLGRRLGIG